MKTGSLVLILEAGGSSVYYFAHHKPKKSVPLPHFLKLLKVVLGFAGFSALVRKKAPRPLIWGRAWSPGTGDS